MFDRPRYASYAGNTKWSELREVMVSFYSKASSFRAKMLNWPGEGQYASPLACRLAGSGDILAVSSYNGRGAALGVTA